MATWGRSNDRAATRRRTGRGLGVLLLVSATAVASAHGIPTASDRAPDPADGSALTRAAASAVTIPEPVASAVSLDRWATALSAGRQPGVRRPFRATPPIPTAVPPAADLAYHRAAVVLAGAAPSCGLDWSLLAAIGHVESDHGGRNASTLGDDGVSRPGVVGPAIDVPGPRGPLPDTDGGDLDGTGTEDRAVGALQLLPGAWSAAAVDGDADGLRNPQDVDDAALAAGVLLCTSSPGLGSEAGLRRALRHYNPMPGYVDTVERLATAYALTEVLSSVVSAVVDAVPTPPQLAGTTGPGTSAMASPAVAATPTPVVTPSARETVPTSALTAAASSLPSPDATGAGSTLPSPVEASEATRSVADPGDASAPAQPPGTSEPEPATTAAAGPGSDPAPDPEQTPEPRPEPGPEPTNEPAPEPDTSPEPTPAPTPEQGTGDTAAPTPSPAPDIQTVRGVWSLDGASTFLLDGTTVVDVDALGDLTAVAPGDLDGDGAAETLREELTGLAGSTVEARGTTSPDRVAIRSLGDLRVVAP